MNVRKTLNSPRMILPLLFIGMPILLFVILVFLFISPYIFDEIDIALGSKVRAFVIVFACLAVGFSYFFIPSKWRQYTVGFMVIVFMAIFLIPQQKDILLDLLQLPPNIQIKEVIRRTFRQYKFSYSIKIETEIDQPITAARKIYRDAIVQAGAEFLGYDTRFIYYKSALACETEGIPLNMVRESEKLVVKEERPTIEKLQQVKTCVCWDALDKQVLNESDSCGAVFPEDGDAAFYRFEHDPQKTIEIFFSKISSTKTRAVIRQ